MITLFYIIPTLDGLVLFHFIEAKQVQSLSPFPLMLMTQVPHQLMAGPTMSIPVHFVVLNVVVHLFFFFLVSI